MKKAEATVTPATTLPVSKYILLKTEARTLWGAVPVYRILYVKDIPRHGIKAGDRGGWLSSEKNLSHEGACVVLKEAVVCDDATVEGHAVVTDTVFVQQNARIGGSVRLRGNVILAGRIVVHGEGGARDLTAAEDEY